MGGAGGTATGTGIGFWTTGAVFSGAVVVATIPGDTPAEMPDGEDSNLQEDMEYAGNAAEIHRWCNEPEPPYFLNECDRWKWKLNKAQMCQKAREEHTNKWFNGEFDAEHAAHMQQLEREINRAKDNVQRFCGEDCEY